MSLTDSATIAALYTDGTFAFIEDSFQFDSDENLISPTEVWLYKTTTDNEVLMRRDRMTADSDVDYFMNKDTEGNTLALFFEDPNLIDTANVWTEVTGAE